METSKIELPNGGWAVLRDPAAVPVRLRRPVEKALLLVSRKQSITSALGAAEDPNDPAVAARLVEEIDSASMDMLNDLNDYLIMARVESWSFGDVSLDAILDLPASAYTVLQTECAKDITKMMPDFSVSGSPDSPTKPSDV